MSLEIGNLCSAIIEQCFGEVVRIVAECLFAVSKLTLANIIKITKLTRKQVVLSLSVLIKFHLVNFQASDIYPFLLEYHILHNEVIYFMRYSRYIEQIQSKFGEVGVVIAEELLTMGSDTATNTIVKCLVNSQIKEKPETIRDKFVELIKNNYLIRMPELRTKRTEDINTAADESTLKFQTESCNFFHLPEIDLQLISKIVEGTALLSDATDTGILWRINPSRFHQDFRDMIMTNAIERKLGESAAECFRFILTEVYDRTEVWSRKSSNPFTIMQIKQSIEKKSKNWYLIKHLEQYVSIIADDSLGFIRKIDDVGYGQYIVDFERAFTELTLACTEGIIKERFGSKATRIFRVVRFKKYIEQEELQKEAMIPSKEAKSLAYNLFQERFIHIKIIRKPGGIGGVSAKSFYLFFINELQLVQTLFDICYKALYNAIRRSNYEKLEYKEVIEKSDQLDQIIKIMKESGEMVELINELQDTLTPPEKEIVEKVKVRVKTLAKAELTIDDTLFLLQLYQHHCTEMPTIIGQ